MGGGGSKSKAAPKEASPVAPTSTASPRINRATIGPNFIFDPTLLGDLDSETIEGDKTSFGTDGISVGNPGANLVIRPLARDDYDKGFLKLLSELTSVGDVSQKQFEARFDEMKATSGTYYPIVIEDVSINKIIGAGTLVVEKKFIRETAKRGHIEDIVVDSTYRGRQLGKLVIQVLKIMAKRTGCYKVTLDCSSSNVPFYEKCSFAKEDIHLMTIRFVPK